MLPIEGHLPTVGMGEAGFGPEISWALSRAGGPLALRPSCRHDPQGDRAVTLNVIE